MAGIMAAMKSFDSLGTAFSSNPALKAVQQAQQRKQAQAASQTAGVAGVAGATPAPVAPPEVSATDTKGLEARIAALETAGSNTPSATSSMTPQAVATGEAIFGTPEQRNSSINPFNSTLI